MIDRLGYEQKIRKKNCLYPNSSIMPLVKHTRGYIIFKTILYADL